MITFSEGELLSAGKLNQLAGMANGQPTPGRHEYAGQSVPAEPWEGWIKITSAASSAQYDYTEQVVNSSGAFVNGYKAGTISAGTGAREINGNNSIALNTVVRAWQGVFGVLFQLEVCP